ncbi:GDSL-type esterase/lipase family protein [Candidatus Zixiibacteriota bacterium]
MSGASTPIRRGRLPVYAILVTLVVLALLELTARLAEPTAHRTLREFRLGDVLTEYKLWQQTLFLSFGGIHRPDPELLWRFRSRLRRPLFTTNSRGLLTAEEIEYQKPPNTTRILLLGDSSPVGLGLQRREEAFGELAAQLLQRKLRGQKKIELLNAAVSGYTSEQAKRFLQKEGLQYQPDFVVCYLGNNDGSINGYLTDREIFAAQDWSRTARTALNRLAMYRMLRALISPVLGGQGSAKTGSPLVRLSPGEFGENIEALADISRSIGARAIFVNPPVPYRWPAGLQFKIFSRMADSAGQWVVADPVQQHLERPVAYCLDSATINRPYGRVDPYVREVLASAYADQGAADSIEAYYTDRLKTSPDDPLYLNNLGVILWQKKEFRRAVELFERGVALDSLFNVSRYNLGIALADLGDSLRSREVLRETVDRDWYSLRIKTPYRQALFAAGASSGGLVLDAAELFRIHGNEQLFIDHCHPTPEGHALIAAELARMIDSLLTRGSAGN